MFKSPADQNKSDSLIIFYLSQIAQSPLKKELNTPHFSLQQQPTNLLICRKKISVPPESIMILFYYYFLFAMTTDIIRSISDSRIYHTLTL